MVPGARTPIKPARQSLDYACNRRRGRGGARTALTISAAAADLTTARRLDLPVGAPVISSRRVSFDSGGRPIEYLDTLTRPDRFEYAFQFVRKTVQHGRQRADIPNKKADGPHLAMRAAAVLRLRC